MAVADRGGKVAGPDTATLQRRLEQLLPRVTEKGRLWICWPKKTSAIESDLDQVPVRRHAMDRGLVDFKVAAIDATWSGLRFARKKPA